MENITRIPRPKNATKLALQYANTKKYIDKKKLHSLIVRDYLNNSFLYQNQYTDLKSFSTFTNIPIHTIHKEMLSQVKDTQILTNSQIEKVTQGLLIRTLNGALEDGLLSKVIRGSTAPELLRTLALGQKPIGLLNSMAKHFEVATQLNKLVLEIVDRLQKQPNIMIQNNTLNQTINHTQYLTIDKALQLLDDKANSGQLLDPASQKALKDNYALDSIEDIRAKVTDDGVVAVNLPKVSDELLKDIEWERLVKEE